MHSDNLPSTSGTSPYMTDTHGSPTPAVEEKSVTNYPTTSTPPSVPIGHILLAACVVFISCLLLLFAGWYIYRQVLPSFSSGKTTSPTTYYAADDDSSLKDTLKVIQNNMDVQSKLMFDTNVPVDYPKDIPLYPGATVRTSGTTNINGLVRSQLSMRISKTASDLDEMVKIYEGLLKEKGWSYESHRVTDTARVISAIKESRRMSVEFTFVNIPTYTGVIISQDYRE